MASTGSRTLRLLSLLQARRSWPGSALADRLEVSVRTLRRDVDRLRELGYPVQATRGTDGGYRLAAGAVLPLLVLDDEEAVALAVGLQAATSSSVVGTAEASLRALTKVVQVLPPRLRRRVDALRAATVGAPWPTTGPPVDADLLVLAAQACRDEERLAMTYVAADGARTHRTVEPHRLVPLGRRWYLVAYDLDRHDWRSFRLDRLAGLTATGVAFRSRPLPAQDAASFVRHGIERVPAPYDVRAVVHAPAEQVRRRLGRWAELEERDAGSCRLRLSTDALDWAALTLGAAGAELSEVEPPELVEHLRAWAGRFARATG